MGKQRHDSTPNSSKSTLAAMGIGGVLVAGLIVWALTRTVEPATTTDTAPVAATSDPSAFATAASPGTDTTASTVSTPTPSPAPLTTAPPLTNAIDTPTLAPPVQNERSAVARMAVEDLRAKATRGDVTVVDVRDAASYARGHIPGAVHVPFASIEAGLGSLPKNKPIVTYCT